MPKKAIVLLAEGFEEVEAITPIDYLRRAGIDVTSAAIGEKLTVKGSHNIEISADTRLKNLLEEGNLKSSVWDLVVVPGGLPGSDNLAASKETGSFLKEMASEGKLVAAICSAPARVLFPLGLLDGKKFTCHPGQEANIGPSAMAGWKEDRVVVDGALITSRGPGTAAEFACAIIDRLLGDNQGKIIAGKTLTA